MQQITIGFQSIVQCGREGVLRGKPIAGAEHTHTRLHRKQRTETQCIFQITAVVAASVQI